MSVRTRILLAVLVMLVVFLVGTAGYVAIEGASFEDAAYMTVITLSTVGYREVFEMGPWGRVWTSLLLAFGIAAVFAAFGLITSMVVSGEVGRLMGIRKLHARIEQLEDHVILCGFGRVGSSLARELLARNLPLVVIDNDVKRTREAEELKLLYVLGDASEEDTLAEAGIRRARALVAVLAHDADNLFVTLTARSLRPSLYIVARAEQMSTESKLRRAGANRVVSPQNIGAMRIANILTRPHVVDFVDVAAKGVELEMDEFVIHDDSPICNQTLRDAQLRQRANVMVVAIKHADGQSTFNPGPDAVLHHGDAIITIGPTGAAARLAALAREGRTV